MSDGVALAFGVALLAVLVVLSAAESALSGITRSRAEALDEDDVSGASELVESLADRGRLLAPVLVLALGAQLALGATVAVVVERNWGVGAVPVAVIGLLTIVYVIAESSPKAWSRANIDRAAPAAAKFARLLHRFPPLRWITWTLTLLASRLLGSNSRPAPAVANEDEVVALADAAVAAEVLDVDEGEIIHSIVEFGDTIVREVMVPRPDVLAVSSETSVDRAIELLVERGVSRMPVYGGDIDDIRGVVHIKDLFARVQRGRGSHFVSIAQREPHFVPETKLAAVLLRELKGVPHNMVVIIDEYGGTAGIVTLEDLIEEFLGEIIDEFDAVEEPLLEPLRLGEWRVHGRIPIDEFNELIGTDLPDDDWDTLGGLIFDALGHVPEVGESITESGFVLTVEQVESRRITRVRVVEAGPSESVAVG